jgi:S1-C subfamily serine protease
MPQSSELPPNLKIALWILKLVSIVLGFTASMVCLMATVGLLTDNGYARAITAVALCVILPLAIADRLLPADDPTRGKGLISDVFAVGLLGFALAFTGAVRFTGPMLVREGDRLSAEGYEALAAVAYLLGNVKATPAEAPAAAPSASSTADVTDAGAADAEADAATEKDAGKQGSTTSDASVVPAKSGDKTPAELFRDLAPSVVTIFVKKGDQEGGGTGFVIDDEAGVVVTNHHVIRGASAVKIKFQNGAAYDDVDLLADDAEADLSILGIDIKKPLEGGAAPKVDELLLGDSDKVVVGERAIAIGNPLGLDHTLTDGIVSARRVHEGRAWIQISVPISPGNSGGPLFDMRGEVIGITTAQFGGPFAGAQNLNLAVPVNDLKRLIKPSYPARRRIGDPNTASGHW